MGNFYSTEAAPQLTDEERLQNLKKAMVQPEEFTKIPAWSNEVDEEMEEKIAKLPKIELHCHLDGSVRFSTLLELGQAKGISMKGATTVEELKKVLITDKPANLAKVLEAFEIFLPVIVGDLEAIERIAYELAEDQHSKNTVYFEGRYSPHLLLSADHPEVTPTAVVEAVKRGFDRAEQEFGIKARSILCCIRGLDKHSPALILDLATNLKHLGVVGIDVAGSAHGADEQYEPEVIEAFQEAAKRGIHRTAHAGESGGPKEVLKAIETMQVQRIGHGYRVMRDPELYRERFVEDHSVHLEACPYSSVMTGAVPLDWPHHPVGQWTRDSVNFSISTDDKTCFDNTMQSELELAHQEIGLDLHQLWICQLNAAQSCFLEEPEKSKLIELIKKSEPESE